MKNANEINIIVRKFTVTIEKRKEKVIKRYTPLFFQFISESMSDMLNQT